MNTIKAITSVGEFNYTVDNSGKTDVSGDLQKIFDELGSIPNVSATVIFTSGCYFIDAPIFVNISSLRLEGTGHGGLDIHGQNQLCGTVLRFGQNCKGDCITFTPAKSGVAFPSGKTPWEFGMVKLSFSHINFMGHNNTDVDTANGYSRFTSDEPNFRGLRWYPAKDRYSDPEKEGQKAIVVKNADKCKVEMFDMEYCYFTDLFVGADVQTTDVSTIHHCWFGQMVNGIIYHSAGQVMTLHDNCFADIETCVQLASNMATTLHDNGFAFVSKCFVLKNIHETTIHHNTVKNWAMATGTASCSNFLHITGEDNKNVSITGNVITNEIASHVKTRTVDEKPDGRAFIQVENCKNLIFSNNLVDTVQDENAVKFIGCKNIVTNSNLLQPDTNFNEIDIV